MPPARKKKKQQGHGQQQEQVMSPTKRQRNTQQQQEPMMTPTKRQRNQEQQQEPMMTPTKRQRSQEQQEQALSPTKRHRNPLQQEQEQAMSPTKTQRNRQQQEQMMTPTKRQRNQHTQQERVNQQNGETSLRNQENLDHDEENQVDGNETPLLKKIKMIISGTCKILKATPFFNIQKDSQSLKKYEKALDTALLRHIDKIDRTGLKIFKTKISFEKLRTLSNEQNQNEKYGTFMFIEVFEHKDRDDDRGNRCFMSMFCGRGSSGVGVQYLERTKDCQNLPSVIYNGPTKYWKILQSALEELFSCTFLINDLTPPRMKSITTAWILEAIRTHIAQRQNTLRISYVPGLGAFSFGEEMVTLFTFKSFISKWKTYLDDPNVNLRKATIDIWKDIAQAITFQEKINFSKALTLNIATTSFIINSTGKFKLRMEDSEMILAILRQITEALEESRA